MTIHSRPDGLVERPRYITRAEGVVLEHDVIGVIESGRPTAKQILIHANEIPFESKSELWFIAVLEETGIASAVKIGTPSHQCVIVEPGPPGFVVWGGIDQRAATVVLQQDGAEIERLEPINRTVAFMTKSDSAHILVALDVDGNEIERCVV